MKTWPNTVLQRLTADPLGQRAVRENWLEIVPADRAFPAAVVERGR